LTAFPSYNPRVLYSGTHESFVFSVISESRVEQYQSEDEENRYYLNCDYKSLSIGNGGDGPAIRLDEELHKGRSNAC